MQDGALDALHTSTSGSIWISIFNVVLQAKLLVLLQCHVNAVPDSIVQNLSSRGTRVLPANLGPSFQIQEKHPDLGSSWRYHGMGLK